MAQHCPECGSKLKPNAKFCQSCGAAVQGGNRAPRARKLATNPPWHIIGVIGGGALLLVLALVLILSGGQGTQAQVANPPTDEHGADVPYPDVERVAVDEAYAMVQNGEALLVDVRDRTAFTEAHAENALSLPEEELATRINELPRDQLIVTYCT